MSILGRDLAVDLGAARTRIYIKRKGIVLDEPSAVLLDRRTGKVIAFGAEAVGDGRGETHWPVNGGLPADAELAQRLVRHFTRKVHWRPYARPRLVMALPGDSTPMARAALHDMAYEAQARDIVLVPQALAAALGAGLPSGDRSGQMIIDIGRHATRVAVLSGDMVVAHGSVPYGGRAMDRAIARLVEREHGLALDEFEAEAAKMRAGAAPRPADGEIVPVHARDPDTGRERVLALPVRLLCEVAAQPAGPIARIAEETVARCPAELAADLGERGAVLVGGGALLPGLGRRLREHLRMPVRPAERPLESVALGLGRCLDHLGLTGRLRSRLT
ncbi:rod shape-determining protein MreB [Nonomuraea maritima]|uniref:Rod shape-determining protein MreB n=1 Tax=Nonomuraea maritima TaxID=683260 RepID=A0A1G8V3F5_9ACTN|nr:rod shape-determining protein [Nonomuraea maritima]SDJ60384.1 rod shape-determining protein MreB [Nonomuraea maritima]